ncbi:uncharacterized protein SCHCODRAFT_02727025 [Schizophyllum commune H4-8]|uniref:uncharacterized protein n=1 Tax=Schizophyllum commune (strain H4-8 / FGSC 9210) TaxID=578458 RepID=UPI00215F6AFC|nr:uncharacterized protein SCHCODRAFT_02727025 [Schizophyllum commune H4-8]KAI5894937.1 hypothetical protein SCHCODRAFT_02727025 [Schizophyllum commune H4-8]
MFVYALMLPLSVRKGRGSQGSAVCASRLLLQRTSQAMKTDVGGVVRPRGRSSCVFACVTSSSRSQHASALRGHVVRPPARRRCMPAAGTPTNRRLQRRHDITEPGTIHAEVLCPGQASDETGVHAGR